MIQSHTHTWYCIAHWQLMFPAVLTTNIVKSNASENTLRLWEEDSIFSRECEKTEWSKIGSMVVRRDMSNMTTNFKCNIYHTFICFTYVCQKMKIDINRLNECFLEESWVDLSSRVCMLCMGTGRYCGSVSVPSIEEFTTQLNTDVTLYIVEL